MFDLVYILYKNYPTLGPISDKSLNCRRWSSDISSEENCCQLQHILGC